MKTVLITGGNKGIGFEIARQLGEKGFHVIVSGRSEERLQVAVDRLCREGINAELLVMDVSQFASIEIAAGELKKRQIRLDVLINNAGILLPEDLSMQAPDHDILETTVITNAYGPLWVAQCMLQQLNRPGRIVNLSSGGGSMTDPVGGWAPAYCVSKTMLNAITRHQAFELSGMEISVNAVCPGWVKTEMGGTRATRSVEKGAETPVWLALEAAPSFSGKFFRDKKVIPW